jgi:hypothetical protein
MSLSLEVQHIGSYEMVRDLMIRNFYRTDNVDVCSDWLTLNLNTAAQLIGTKYTFTYQL